jgi:DNA sulfur modification protein DndD
LTAATPSGKKNLSYDISVYNKEGTEMTGSLSATEQMALAYAFTLAIHNASGKNCPLVIDSPLGRVSDKNRENMAEALRDVSKTKQIIMLFTPDEYSDEVRTIYDGVATVKELVLSDDENYVEGVER